MLARLAVLAAGLAISGCTSFQWSRLAPPGIVKYEHIADEKPQNPAIAEEIAQYQDVERKRFPVLSQTPAAGDPPEPPPAKEVDAALAETVTARDGLTQTLDADAAAVEAEREGRALLDAGRDSLVDQIDRDEAAVRRERAEQAPALSEK